MTTEERIQVRTALINAGFNRRMVDEPDDPRFYDRGDGMYLEIWRSKKDRTRIELHWDKKTKE